MKKMLYPYLIFCCLIISFSSFAQGEKLGIKFENRGLSGLNAPDPALNDNIEVGRIDLGINASFKNKIDKQKLGLTTLTIGAEYRYMNLSYESLLVPNGDNLVEDLHNVRLQVDFMKVLKNRKWILSILLRPGIFSDFQNVSSEHFRVEGVALLDYRKSQQTLIGFGVGRSARFGRLLILPVFHYFHKTPKFTADIILPARIDVGWNSKKLYYGLNMTVSGNQFRIGNERNGFIGTNTIGVSDVTLGPTFRYSTGKKSYLSLSGGVTGLRRWEFRNDDLSRDDRLIQDFDPNLTWFARAGFIIKH